MVKKRVDLAVDYIEMGYAVYYGCVDIVWSPSEVSFSQMTPSGKEWKRTISIADVYSIEMKSNCKIYD